MGLSITGHFGPEPFRSGAQVGYGPHLFCPSVQSIVETICKRYNVTKVDLVSLRRDAPVTRARQIAIYLCRTLTPSTLPMIGRVFGGRDHSTVMHSVQRIEDLRKADASLDREVSDLLAFLGR